jgi:hypothetical protein
MADTARVNGLQISWSSLVFKIDGEEYTGITKIGYADGLETSLAYGMGRHHAPRGRSAGKYTPEPLTITCWKSTAQAIREQLAALSPSGTSYGRAVVPISLQYVEPDDSVITVEFEECRYTKGTASNEEGPDNLSEDLEFSVLRIRRNGLVLFDESTV